MLFIVTDISLCHTQKQTNGNIEDERVSNYTYSMIIYLLPSTCLVRRPVRCAQNLFQCELANKVTNVVVSVSGCDKSISMTISIEFELNLSEF